MRRILVWSTVCLLLILSQTVHAQSTPDAWPITERCVDKATKPPADWQFEGTLLLKGYRPLHAFRQGWDTPHIVLFKDYYGLLSPDGHWYATIQKESIEPELITTVFTYSITVYSTVDNDKYVIPWENHYSAFDRLYGHQLYWLDNEHLLYSKGDREEKWFTINPFTQEIIDWPNQLGLHSETVYFSPDHNHTLTHSSGDSYIALSDIDKWIEIPEMSIIDWSPDSASFAAYTLKSNPYRLDHLALFDQQGKQSSIIFQVKNERSAITFRGQAWSPDGRYLLFAADTLHLADMDKHTVIDTCISIPDLTIVWSPSSHQIAMLRFDDPKREVQIFDIDRWARYIVAYHSGEVIGWRADD